MAGGNINLLAQNSSHEYVDLGLPSRTLWATCNVGASSPEEFGDYFSWGETEPKYNHSLLYGWGSYKYGKNTHKLTKYCPKGFFGGDIAFTDALRELVPADDAAAVNWGSGWCMPTAEQFNELRENCTLRWTSNYKETGVAGYMVLSKRNKNSIFLPAAGHYKYHQLFRVGDAGFYWTRNLNEASPDEASGYYLNSSFFERHSYDRSCGFTVRPVIPKLAADKLALAANNSDAKEVAPTVKRPQIVDLGLPSGTKWASCNLGASNPNQKGNTYRWGETVPYDKDTEYKWYGNWPENCDIPEEERSGKCTTKYCIFPKKGIVDNKRTLDLEDDAASVALGKGWQIPSEKQINELFANCTYECTKIDAFHGWYRLTSKINGRTLYLPWGSYYTNELSENPAGGIFSGGDCATGFSISDVFLGIATEDKWYGCLIRPVYK